MKNQKDKKPSREVSIFQKLKNRFIKSEKSEINNDDVLPHVSGQVPVATNGPAVAKTSKKKKKLIRKAKIAAAEYDVKKPALRTATIISANPAEKSLVDILERRGGYIFPPRGLLGLDKSLPGKGAIGIKALNELVIGDLSNFGHLLITGTQESGKTNCIHAIVAELLYHSSPEDLRFMVFDSKILDYKSYDHLPHMANLVVTEGKRVPAALESLIAEMDRRYQIFTKTNMRNIAEFNATLLPKKEVKVEAMGPDMSPEEWNALQQVEVPRDDDAFEAPLKKLPHILCVIDDLYDFYYDTKNEIEKPLSRLLKMGTKAGIHFIISIDPTSDCVLSPQIRQRLQAELQLTYNGNRSQSASNLVGDFKFIPKGTGHFSSNGSNPGVVYIMENPSHEAEVLKIGLTGRTAQERAGELSSSSGVPEEFKVLYDRETTDCHASEKAVHSELAYCRVSKNREFFRCSIQDAIEAVDRHCYEDSSNQATRGRSPHVSDDEIKAIAEFLKENNDPPEIDDGGPTDGDELLPGAIDVLRSTKRASTSMLQRRLRIGYNRAARLMEELEERGIVGPENGSSPREIMVDLDAM